LSDFVNEGEVEVNVLGRAFKFKELSGKEMDSMKDKATVIKATGEIGYLLSEQNKAYLLAVTNAPYPEWNGLKSIDERLGFLNKLKAPIRDELINQIRAYHMDLGDALKKL